MFKNKIIKDPVINVSTRISIRSLIRAIEFFNNEKYKSKRSVNDIKYIIDNIPHISSIEKHYARHIYPYIIHNDNLYVLKMFMDRFIPVKDTWALYLSILNNNEELIRNIMWKWGDIHESDILPFIWGSFLNGKKFYTYNNYSYTPIKKYMIVDLNYKNIQNRENMNKIIFEIEYWTRHFLKNRKWESEYVPHEDKTKAIETIEKMIKWAHDEEFPIHDRMEFIIKAYGIVKWGYIDGL